MNENLNELQKCSRVILEQTAMSTLKYLANSHVQQYYQIFAQIAGEAWKELGYKKKYKR